jgi:hypothetical protein
MVSMARDHGIGDGLTETVRLYLIGLDRKGEALGPAFATALICEIAAIVPCHHWWGGPGLVAAMGVSALAAVLAYVLSCRGLPQSIEVGGTRLRILDRRGRPCSQFERAGVEAVELSNGVLHVIERGRRRHGIVVYNSFRPSAVLRLHDALERHGWLSLDPRRGAAV